MSILSNICAIISLTDPFITAYKMGYRSANSNCIVRTIPLRKLSTQQGAYCLFLREEAGRCWTDRLNCHIIIQDLM